MCFISKKNNLEHKIQIKTRKISPELLLSCICTRACLKQTNNVCQEYLDVYTKRRGRLSFFITGIVYSENLID